MNIINNQFKIGAFVKDVGNNVGVIIRISDTEYYVCGPHGQFAYEKDAVKLLEGEVNFSPYKVGDNISLMRYIEMPFGEFIKAGTKGVVVKVDACGCDVVLYESGYSGKLVFVPYNELEKI